MIEDKLNRLGKMSYEEKVVQAIFILASLLWITREFILKNFSITSEVADGTIAIFISILLLYFRLKVKKSISELLIGKWQKNYHGVYLYYLVEA